ncbi:Tn7 transposase TnsA N-terminal domain-containing protein [Delftia lacustris]
MRSVRKIPTNRRSITGFVSWRGQESVPFESQLERDFVLRQEFNLGVASVVSQPCHVPFATRSGVKSVATPDYLVYYKVRDDALGMEHKPMLVEVKPHEDWRRDWREWLSKWVAWAAAGFDDTLLRWQMKPEVVNGEKKDIQSRVQTRGGQTGR